MICHDHLKQLWEGETVQWLKTLKCPCDDDPERTWCDRFIKLEGEHSDQAPAICKGKLMGDTPEHMSLDCHLFSDTKEAHARNVALSFHLKKTDPRKRAASCPKDIFDSIERTINNGAPSPQRTVEDMHRIKNETVGRIAEAKGCHIEDSGKRCRKGNCSDAEREDKQDKKEAPHTLLESEPMDAMVSLSERVRKGEEKLNFDVDTGVIVDSAVKRVGSSV